MKSFLCGLLVSRSETGSKGTAKRQSFRPSHFLLPPFYPRYLGVVVFPTLFFSFLFFSFRASPVGICARPSISIINGGFDILPLPGAVKSIEESRTHLLK